MKYLIVIEKTKTGYSAYSPDLDGCIAAGGTKAEVERLMKRAVRLHLEEMQAAGLAIPKPTTQAKYVDVPA